MFHFKKRFVYFNDDILGVLQAHRGGFFSCICNGLLQNISREIADKAHKIPLGFTVA